MLSIGNKKYRNIQEQVGYNTECIKKLDEYLDGIRVEDKLVVIESDSGTFTNEELVVLSGPLAFISNGSRVWMKDSETLVEFVYKAIDIKADEVRNAYFNIGGSKIVVNRETGAYNTSFDSIVTTYNKDQIDSIVANIMAIKADKSELASGLALKANVAGQVFTGEISGPSILELMSGYSFTKVSGKVTLNYAGVTKTGNKITFVVSGKYESDTATSTYTTIQVGRFDIPASIGAKLYNNSLSYLDNRMALVFTSLYSTKNLIFLVQKNNNAQIEFQITTGEVSLDANTPYYFRNEVTFLLSDNLAS